MYGHKVGQHPLITQLMEGVFNRKPPQPRYNETWDVNKMLEHLKKLGKKSDIKILDKKLAMLMALTSASRCSELHQIYLSKMTDLGDSVSFPITRLTKSKRPNKLFLTLTFHKYTPDGNIDVVSCLDTYVEVTETLRVSKKQHKCLFLGFIKPHKLISSSTIARWLTTLMSEAGIDSTFKAHSTRAVSSSKAKAQGVSGSQIIKCVNWSKATTFQRFYNKPITGQDDKQSFQNAVLSV